MSFKNKIITKNSEEELQTAIDEFFTITPYIQQLYNCSYTAVKPDARSKVIYSVLIVYKIHS